MLISKRQVSQALAASFLTFGLSSFPNMRSLAALPVAIILAVRVAAPYVARLTFQHAAKMCVRGASQCSRAASAIGAALRQRGVRNPARLAEQIATRTLSLSIVAGTAIILLKNKNVTATIRVENNSNERVPFAPSEVELVNIIEYKTGIWPLQKTEVIEFVEHRLRSSSFSLNPGAKTEFIKKVPNSEFVGKKIIRIVTKNATYSSEPFFVLDDSAEANLTHTAK